MEGEGVFFRWLGFFLHFWEKYYKILGVFDSWLQSMYGFGGRGIFGYILVALFAFGPRVRLIKNDIQYIQ